MYLVNIYYLYYATQIVILINRTSKGKQRAIVTAISEEDFEDYLLEQSPELLDILEEARMEYIRKGGITLEDYLSTRKRKQSVLCGQRQ